MPGARRLSTRRLSFPRLTSRRLTSRRRGRVVGVVDAARLGEALARLRAHGAPVAVRVEAWPGTIALVTSGTCGTTTATGRGPRVGEHWWEVERVRAMVPLRWPVPAASVEFEDLLDATRTAGHRRVRLRVTRDGITFDGRLLRVAGTVRAAPVPRGAPVPVTLGADATIVFPAGVFPTSDRRAMRSELARRVERRPATPLEAFAIDGSWFVRAEHDRGGSHAALLIGALEGPSVHPSPASFPVTAGAVRPDRVLH